MPDSISESRFYMWRTLFAIAHVDHVISKEEVRFMAEALEDVPFSKEQREILRQDSLESRDVVEMFKSISDPKDQAEFFRFARELVWADGAYGSQEQDILLKLQKLHLKNVRVDDLVDKVDLQFEEDRNYAQAPRASEPKRKKGIRSLISAFIEQFEEERGLKD